MGWFDYLNDKGQKESSKEKGGKVEVLWGFKSNGEHSHATSRDGVNADYVRLGDTVVVDTSKADPAEPYKK